MPAGIAPALAAACACSGLHTRVVRVRTCALSELAARCLKRTGHVEEERDGDVVVANGRDRVRVVGKGGVGALRLLYRLARRKVQRIEEAS